MIDKPIPIINAPAVFFGKIAGQGFRFSDAMHDTVTLDILD